MATQFRPMLAQSIEDLSTVQLPVYCTPKIDGIRCLIYDGMAMTRTLKPIPNPIIRQALSSCQFPFDGELVTLTNGVCDDFNTIQHKVMSQSGVATDFIYYVFDICSQICTNTDFEARMVALGQMLENTVTCLDSLDTLEMSCRSHQIYKMKHMYIEDKKSLLAYEQLCVDNGYEGIIMRKPRTLYKYGRSTLLEGCLLKYKRFQDTEAIIVDVQELCRSTAPAEIDSLGLSKLSQKKEYRKHGDTLGALIVEDIQSKARFKIGSGFTDQMRKSLWSDRASLIGKTITYTYQEKGINNVPRFPVFKGFRRMDDTIL